MSDSSRCARARQLAQCMLRALRRLPPAAAGTAADATGAGASSGALTARRGRLFCEIGSCTWEVGAADAFFLGVQAFCQPACSSRDEACPGMSGGWLPGQPHLDHGCLACLLHCVVLAGLHITDPGQQAWGQHHCVLQYCTPQCDGRPKMHRHARGPCSPRCR